MSPKFLNLQRLRNKQQLKHLVPPFYKVPKVSIQLCEKKLLWFKKLFNYHATYILRSSLSGEGGQKLRPGQSLSIGNIQSFNSFIKAYKKIACQPKLSGIILQEQKFLDHHLTGVFFKNIAFLENTDLEKHFFLNQYSHIGAHDAIPPKTLNSIYKALRRVSKHLKHSEFIVELGLCNEQVFVFQITPTVRYELTETLMTKYEELLQQEARRENFSFLGELVWLWRGFKLRWLFNKKPQIFASHHNCYEHVVSNWRALISCYRAYTWWKPQAGFFDFYSWAMGGSSRWARWIKQHFSMATYLSEGSFVSQDFMKNYKKMIFLGHQTHTCWLQKSNPSHHNTTDLKAYFLDNLNPRDVYALPEGSVILTSSSNLLSHGFLAAIERNLPLVGNIPAEQLKQLKKQKAVRVQFKEQQIIPLENELDNQSLAA